MKEKVSGCFFSEHSVENDHKFKWSTAHCGDSSCRTYIFTASHLVCLSVCNIISTKTLTMM